MKGIELVTAKKSERLAFSEDFDGAYENEKSFSFLYVPNLDDFEHYHIDISLEQGRALKNFLINYFKEEK